jgi:hypothetical protein
MAMDPTRRVWTVRSTHNDQGTAGQYAEALQHKQRLRVRVMPGTRRSSVPVKPAVVNATTVYRQQQAAAMSDLADASKRYKSPG